MISRDSHDFRQPRNARQAFNGCPRCSTLKAMPARPTTSAAALVIARLLHVERASPQRHGTADEGTGAHLREHEHPGERSMRVIEFELGLHRQACAHWREAAFDET